MSNLEWARVYAQLVDGLTPKCPVCGESEIQSRFIGDTSTRIGYGRLWCTACEHGGHLSRIELPASLEMHQFGDPEALVGVPDTLSPKPPDEESQ